MRKAIAGTLAVIGAVGTVVTAAATDDVISTGEVLMIGAALLSAISAAFYPTGQSKDTTTSR